MLKIDFFSYFDVLGSANIESSFCEKTWKYILQLI